MGGFPHRVQTRSVRVDHDAGRNVALHVPAIMSEVLNAHLAGFTCNEWQELASALSRMLANGDAMNSRS